MFSLSQFLFALFKTHPHSLLLLQQANESKNRWEGIRIETLINNQDMIEEIMPQQGPSFGAVLAQERKSLPLIS